jgi:hypothetical protein
VALAGGVIVLVTAGAFDANTRLYFEDYRIAYENASLPYSEPGQFLRGFTLLRGSAGNAFMVAYPYWWDHRAIGIEGGAVNWPNGIISRDEIPTFLYQASQRTDKYRFDPAKDMAFFLSPEDTETAALLQQWFPGGRLVHHTSYQANNDFVTYEAPALGEEAFLIFLRSQGVDVDQ